MLQENRQAPDRAVPSFSYTYSAQNQEEIERIRQKYAAPQEDKMARLRHLDRLVERPGTIVSISLGIAGTLMLGIGMCCTMVWTSLFVPGIAVGLTGIAGICAAYPLYGMITRRAREKYAPQVLKLIDELSRRG
ncbi:MAG: hypothetical protein Q4F18_05465 [Clostridia bacterium]|nr:hypothetical protein [Clostridia bacterium]